MIQKTTSNRRRFIKKSALLTLGLSTGTALDAASQPPSFSNESIYMIGPQEGFSPQIGTLLSTMTMMRTWLIESVKNLGVEQLDFQLDDKSNSIGAMLLHLAATEKYYQLNTFEGMEWGSWSDEIKSEWDVPMNLGEKGREVITGHELSYYLEKLNSVRKITVEEFAKRDDEWIMKSEPFFNNEPTNNYCKWFHVCEHESNHRGQIKMIKKRMPGS